MRLFESELKINIFNYKYHKFFMSITNGFKIIQQNDLGCFEKPKSQNQ